MALKLNPTRLRRILSLSSSFLSSPHHRLPSSTTTNSLLQTPLSFSSSSSDLSSSSFRFFHSTHLSFSSSRSFNDVDKIDPDTILFEGCDYKHWLIVMDFGNDPDKRCSSEEMVETYVQTLAKVVGSVEEAKKRMYACSTTTYTGFQAEMDEETSNKFEGMPGVIFILPDSYIDPVNKEYGGDKYINGTIIPRSPPVQYGRVKRGRQNDQRPSGQMPNQQGNHAYNQNGSMPGEGRGYMPRSGVRQRQHYPSNYGPDQGGRSNPMNGMIYSEQGRGGYPGGGKAYVPPHRLNYNQGYTPHQIEYHPGDQGNFRRGEPGYNHPQGQMRNLPRDHVGYQPQRQMNYPGDSRNYAPQPPPRGADGQTGAGSYQQFGAGRYEQGPNVASDHGANVRYPEGSPEIDRSFSQAPDEQNARSTENRSYTSAAQTGMNQGRF